jgi:DNA-binding GntR family transcriptional regulator
VRLPPKAREAADTVRAMIADGVLLPGAAAPSAPRLARQTGTCPGYCRLALRALVEDGTLKPGNGSHGRPRVPGRDRKT